MQDRGPRLSLEHPLRHQGGHQRPAHALGALVHQEHPVRVPVEGQTDVGAVLGHSPPNVLLVPRIDGIRGVVRERPVQLHEQGNQFRSREPLEQGRHDQSGHPVRRVGHHGERSERVEIDEGEQVLQVLLDEVLPLHRPGRAGGARRLPFGQLPDLLQPRGLPDRRGPLAAELQPVVPGRVVAGGEHPAGERQPPRREVDHVGGGQPDVDHAHAFGRDAAGERLGERR